MAAHFIDAGNGTLPLERFIQMFFADSHTLFKRRRVGHFAVFYIMFYFAEHPGVTNGGTANHDANYLKGLPGIKEYRNRLVILKTVAEVEAVLDEVLTHYQGVEIEHNPIVLENYHEHCAI